jgi:DNA-binding Xre family transcriptional regulator
MISHSDIGKQIKLAMQANQISNKRLALDLGVTEQRVYSITKAKDLRLSTFLKICDIVGVSPNQLLEY